MPASFFHQFHLSTTTEHRALTGHFTPPVRRIQPSLDAKGRVMHWRCSACRWTYPEAPGYTGLKAPPATFYQFSFHHCAEHVDHAGLDPVDVVPPGKREALHTPRVAAKLDAMLEGAMEAVGTSQGIVQLYDQGERALELVAGAGFDPEFKQLYRWVHPARDSTVCSMAFRQQRRVMVEDVFATPELAPLAPAAETFGFAACTCTPLREKTGRVFGTLSTHFITPYVPDPGQLTALDRHLAAAIPGLITLLSSL